MIQVRPARASASRTRLGFAGEHRALAGEGVAPLVAFAHGLADHVLFLDAVGEAVDGHVQPGAEEVLVEGCAQARGQLGDVVRAALGEGAGEDDAGGLGFEFDGAVQVEVPVEAVVVVADGGEEGDHQAAVAAGVVDAGPEVAVLGQDAPVLLVHADAVADLARVAEGVGDDGAEVGDVAEAVAAELQGVGVLAHQVFAGVEVVLPGPDRATGRRRGPPFRRSRPG